MSRLTVAPIVEGHGEQKSAIRTIITRVWLEIVGGEHVEVLSAIRRPRASLVKKDGLLNAIDLADLKLRERDSGDKAMILVLFDADEDLPCLLAPKLLEIVRTERSHLDVAVVLPNSEFETWFAAAATSLAKFFDLSAVSPADDPESAGQRKATVQKWMRGVYGETVDQIRLTQAMDIQLCRSRSKSFDKFCRELEKRR